MRESDVYTFTLIVDKQGEVYLIILVCIHFNWGKTRKGVREREIEGRERGKRERRRRERGEREEGNMERKHLFWAMVCACSYEHIYTAFFVVKIIVQLQCCSNIVLYKSLLAQHGNQNHARQTILPGKRS